MLCRYAIITDTINFSEAAGKTTRLDIEVTDRIESLLNMEREQRTSDYQSIKKAKEDIAGLTVSQCLRKDLKVRKHFDKNKHFEPK